MVDRSRWLWFACLWFACAAAWAGAAPAPAADDLACLSPAEATAENLYARLQEQAFAALDRRDADVAALKTPADLAAWAERRRAFFLAHERHVPEHKGTTTEHQLVGLGSILVGRNTASYRLWDAMRAIDYVSGRPEVDPARIGFTGCSGGGTMTSYVMAMMSVPPSSAAGGPTAGTSSPTTTSGPGSARC
jgi:hypothetical protein